MKKLLVVGLSLFLGLLFFFPVSLVNAQNAGQTQGDVQAPTQEETEEQTKALNAAINALVDRVEKNIQLKEQKWKLKAKTVRKVRSQVAAGTRSAYLKWKSAKGFVEITIYLSSLEEKAHRLFHHRREAIASGIIKELDNIGDEAILVTSGVKMDVSAGVHFRKNKILVDVYASNKDLALLSAPYVIEALD